MHLNFRSQYKFWALADGCMSAIPDQGETEMCMETYAFACMRKKVWLCGANEVIE